MKILIFGYGNNSTLATSNILLGLSELLVKNSDIDIYLFGYGEKRAERVIDDKIKIFSIKNPFLKWFLSFYRVKRKILKVLKKDRLCLSWKELFKGAERIFKNEAFDYVIGASGPSYYMNAAYNFAFKNSYKFGMIYFDPFTNNISSINRQKRKCIEKKWYEYSSFVFEESNASKMPFLDCKNISHEYFMPIFLKDFNYVEKGYYVYGGSFYSKFRSEKLLEEFLNNDYCHNEKFKIFSNKKECFSHFSNVDSNGVIDGTKYNEICKNAKGIIVIGNGENSSVMPSKILDAISYKKPIIGLNLKKDLIKYPFYFSGEDKEVFKKINCIKRKDLEEFNFYFNFPNHDPLLFAKSLIEELEK